MPYAHPMGKRITIIQGHPDPARTHLCHFLADTYAESAMAAGHAVRRIETALLEFSLLRTADDWKTGNLPATLRDSQAAVAWAEHLVVVFPLWTGGAPALLKGFFEHAWRPGFALGPKPGGGLQPLLTGRTARTIVTMGMPGSACRWTWHSWGIRSFNRGLLGMAGIGPARTTYIGGVNTPGFRGADWLAAARELGRRAA